jgi:hypothetical protein
MSKRVPIGGRIYRTTHWRINRIAHELGVTNGEVIDQAIARMPVLQCEMPVGTRPWRHPIRAYVRRERPRQPAQEP